MNDRQERGRGPRRTLPLAALGWAGTLVLAGTLALAGCKGNDDAKAETATPVPAMTIGPENIAVVDSTLLEAGPVVSGTLEPVQMATLRAEVGGTVLHTYAEQGERVKKGQVLARIEATALEDALLSARAGVRTAESQATLARRNAERSATLAKAGAIADRDLETAQQQASSAEAALADARARLAQAQKQVANATVEAPFDGIVSERQVDAGDVVQPGAALFTVVDNRALQLEASVPAEQLADLEVGTTVRFSVNGLPDTTFTGKIERINPTADPATRQVKIYATIPNAQHRLVGGLFAQGQVTVERRPALLVPASAVDQRGVTPTVLRLEHGKAEQVAVALGARDPQRNRLEITRGLAAGDTVLVGNAQGVSPGTPVKVVALKDQTAAER